MRRGRFKPKSDPFGDPTINLTPLIDVVFVILIMFIVIAPLLRLDRIELANAPEVPQELLAAAPAKSPIQIHVAADNTLLFNNRPITLKDLKPLLALSKQKAPEATPLVFHDKRAPFGTYQAIKNAAEEAGFASLDILLEP